MQDQLTIENAERLHGRPVLDRNGDQIGAVEELFVDTETGQAEWIGLGTGFFGTKRVLVPAQAADVRKEGIVVPYEKDHVKDAPDIDADEISPETERALYTHYSLEGDGESALPSSDRYMESDKPPSEGELTRSEEELRVGKREVERGRLRLHKWVETEQVEVPMEVRREKARVYREPVDERAADQPIGEDALEVTLREEEPVVDKRTVAKERIGIQKEVETDQEVVGDELRKERVDVDRDPDKTA